MGSSSAWVGGLGSARRRSEVGVGFVQLRREIVASGQAVVDRVL